MDEPTSALSPAECERLFRIIRQLAAEGVAHRLHLAPHRRGLRARRPGHRAARRPPRADRADRRAEPRAASSPRWSGARRSAAGAARRGSPARSVLSVRGLSLDGADAPRLAAACSTASSFDLRAGEILGIGGLLGSGPHRDPRDASSAPRAGRRGGEIALDGEPVAIDSPRQARAARPRARHRGPQGRGAAPRADRSATTSRCRRSARIARFGVRSLRRRGRGRARRRCDELGVRCTGIEQVAATLSGGNQQKVVIGKWLATRPARAAARRADPRHRRRRQAGDLRPRSARCAAEGLAIVMVSSELPELLLLADRILVMSRGPADRRARRAPRRARRRSCSSRRPAALPRRRRRERAAAALAHQALLGARGDLPDRRADLAGHAPRATTSFSPTATCSTCCGRCRSPGCRHRHDRW